MIRRTKYVRIEEMDLTSGAREFHDIEDEVEKDSGYSEMNWKQKVIYNIKNW